MDALVARDLGRLRRHRQGRARAARRAAERDGRGAGRRARRGEQGREEGRRAEAPRGARQGAREAALLLREGAAKAAGVLLHRASRTTRTPTRSIASRTSWPTRPPRSRTRSSGAIQAADGSFVDSDVNDPNTNPVSNDTSGNGAAAARPGGARRLREPRRAQGPDGNSTAGRRPDGLLPRLARRGAAREPALRGSARRRTSTSASTTAPRCCSTCSEGVERDRGAVRAVLGRVLRRGVARASRAARATC